MPVAIGLMVTPRNSAFDHVSETVFRSGQRTFAFSFRFWVWGDAIWILSQQIR